MGFLSDLVALRNLNITCNMTGIGLKHLTCLTRLHLWFCESFTDEYVKCLGNIMDLRDLSLALGEEVTDVGVQHLTSLRLLTRISLFSCPQITDKSAAYLGLLETSRDFNLGYCVGMTGGGLQQLV